MLGNKFIKLDSVYRRTAKAEARPVTALTESDPEPNLETFVGIKTAARAGDFRSQPREKKSKKSKCSLQTVWFKPVCARSEKCFNSGRKIKHTSGIKI